MPDQIRSTSEFALRLEGVAPDYGDFTVLRDISMEARPGQVVAIMGGQGSGKTTLHRVKCGSIFTAAFFFFCCQQVQQHSKKLY